MSKPTEDKNAVIPDHLIKELLTESEMRMVKQRYIILGLLEQGLSVRSIASEVGVGTDTVVRISRLAERHNLKKPSEGRGKSQVTPKPSTSTWVFGKVE